MTPVLRLWSVGGAAPRLPAALALAVLLSGCLGGLQSPGLQGFGKARAPADQVEHKAFAAEGSTASDFPVIADLRARRSVVPQGGSYAAVASAVVAASSGASAAELQMARLNAEAVDKNWLPTIGPVVTLDSLGVMAAQIVAEMALLDNGRRKAERAVAAADVDVAAVVLAADLNDRVRQGLTLYIKAEQARAQAMVAQRGVERLSAFQDMVSERVAGGLSDRSEEQIAAQKRAEMQATYANDMQMAARSLDELAMLAGRPLAGLRGVEPLGAADAVPLSVLKAQGEGARAVALSRAERAGALPGLAATASVDGAGAVRSGLRLGGANFGFGTGARLRALQATPELVARQLDEARQAAARRIAAMQGEAAELRTRQAQGAEVLRQTMGNLDLFVEQYRAGRRSLVELVGQYDAALRLERDQTALGYEIALREVAVAAEQGVLVDGAPM
ncbi:TolC family protein [Paragemmobacter straminiformis]|uniref:TolC family protein n=1 Tax=Paragemmobacter straminiformis TaxID=2045119 RepID=A0A842I994_9RHOB|nr:TolC family protein [Gemmobacter straminiformis]MBC2836199.1 TolC family protein [Gemmobacter straminiformis]